METAIHTVPLPAQDDNGLLLDPGKWNETVAEGLAHTLDIDELSDDHWLIIYALRDYFKKFGVAPAMNNVCRSYHKDKLWVHNLFGSCLNAWCVAGLPDPGEEAKSYLSDM
ncbi:MAG: TusE/DsrC/DsvC family sulfur relay protein [Gammaproteobacteria bacterium]